MIVKERKFAMASTEIAVGVALAVVALFVAIGLFSDNLSTMITSSKIPNIFNNNSVKTKYDSYGRDYSDTQVNVQLLGAQGLQMLRRRANNKALELINNPLSQSNPYGGELAYLADALLILTGEPHLCVYMKEDSDRHCDELDGYSYKMNVSGSSLTITKVDTAGNPTGQSVKLSVISQVTSVISTVSVALDANGYPTLDDSSKYDKILKISDPLVGIIRDDVILLRSSSIFKSKAKSLTTGNGALTPLQQDIIKMANNISSAIARAHKKCSHYGGLSGHDYNFPKSSGGCCSSSLFGDRGDCWVSNAKRNKVQDVCDKISSGIKTVDPSDNQAIEDLVSSLNDVVNYMDNDHVQNPKTCEVYTETIKNINSTYGINIPIQTCVPVSDN